MTKFTISGFLLTIVIVVIFLSTYPLYLQSGIDTIYQRFIERQWFHSTLLFAMASLLFAGLFKTLKVGLNLFDIFIFIYFGLISYSLLFDGSHYSEYEMILPLIMTIGYFTFKFLLCELRSPEKSIVFDALCIIMLVSASYQSVIGILQFFEIQYSPSAIFKVTGTFHNPTPYALYLVINAPFSFGLAHKWRGKSFSQLAMLFSIVNFIILAFGIIISFNRTAWVTLFFLVIFYFFRRYKVDILHFWKRSSYKPLQAFLLFTLIGFSALGIFQIKKDSANGRILIYRVIGAKLSSNPTYLGYGYKSFSRQYNSWQGDWFERHLKEETSYEGKIAGSVFYSYNLYLETIVEFGLIGLIISLAGTIWLLFQAKNINYSLPESILLLSMGSIGIGSLFSFPFEIVSIQNISLIVAGFYSASVPSKRKVLIPRWFLFMLFFGLLMLTKEFINIQQKRSIALKQWKKAKRHFLVKDFNQAILSFESAKDDLFSERYFLQEYGKALSNIGQFEKSNNLLKEAQLFGSDSYLHMTKGMNYQGMSCFEQAKLEYENAHLLNPSALLPQYLLTKLYYDYGCNKEARELAEKIVNQKPKKKTIASEEIKEEMNTILKELKTKNRIYF